MTEQSNPTPNNKELSARLLAVQATYQVLLSGSYIPDIIREYLDERIGMVIEDETIAQPDGRLFKKIMTNLHERMADINEIAKSAIKKKESPQTEEPTKLAEVEPLLMAILLCGTCEILCHDDQDNPLIIDEYLNVTHAFYDKNTVSFVNGVLDSISKMLCA